MPEAWAMAKLAKVMYIILPSRLKLYPNGKINDTILSLQPNRSSSSVSLGKTASLLVVLKATSIGEEIRFNKAPILLPRIKYPTDINITHKRAIPIKKKSRYFP